MHKFMCICVLTSLALKESVRGKLPVLKFGHMARLRLVHGSWGFYFYIFVFGTF